MRSARHMLGGLARNCRHPKGQTRRTVEMACLRVALVSASSVVVHKRLK